MASMPAALAAVVVGNGLSPISSSITRLPAAANCRALAKTLNAASTVMFWAKSL